MDFLNLPLVKIIAFILFMIGGFITCAFIFWRNLRDKGIDDEKIFDNLILITLISIMFARLLFVALNWNLFSANILRIFVIWKFPGFSFWGAIFGGLLSTILYTLKQKLPLAQVFDSYSLAFPYTMLSVSLTSFFFQTVRGTKTNFLWGILVSGFDGKRHPVALYSALLSVIIIFVILGIRKKWQHKLEKGIISALVFQLFGISEFILAFFRDDLLYLDSVSIEHILAFLVLLVSTVFLIFNLIRIKNKNENINITNI